MRIPRRLGRGHERWALTGRLPNRAIHAELMKAADRSPGQHATNVGLRKGPGGSTPKPYVVRQFISFRHEVFPDLEHRAKLKVRQGRLARDLLGIVSLLHRRELFRSSNVADKNLGRGADTAEPLAMIVTLASRSR